MGHFSEYDSPHSPSVASVLRSLDEQTPDALWRPCCTSHVLVVLFCVRLPGPSGAETHALGWVCGLTSGRAVPVSGSPPPPSASQQPCLKKELHPDSRQQWVRRHTWLGCQQAHPHIWGLDSCLPGCAAIQVAPPRNRRKSCALSRPVMGSATYGGLISLRCRHGGLLGRGYMGSDSDLVSVHVAELVPCRWGLPPPTTGQSHSCLWPCPSPATPRAVS